MVLICCKALAVVITAFLPLFDQCIPDFLKGGSAHNMRERYHVMSSGVAE